MLMVGFKSIIQHTIIGHVISRIKYVRDKKRIIFILKNGPEIMMMLPYNKNNNNIITKNRRSIDYNNITNIKIKDLGWGGSGCGINYFYILSSYGDIYRIPCQEGNKDSIYSSNLKLYDYTLYKKEKEEYKKKIKARKLRVKNKVKSMFGN